MGEGEGERGVWIGSHSANASRGGNFGKSNFLYLLVRGGALVHLCKIKYVKTSFRVQLTSVNKQVMDTVGIR